MRFFGLGKKELSNDELRDALFNAVAVSKPGELKELVRNNHARIQTLFRSWKVVPADIRSSSTKTKLWVESVLAIATTAAELGDELLLDLLSPKSEENPLVYWPKALHKAQAEIDRRNYAEGIRILEEILTKVRGLTGTGVDEFLPKTYGLLGTTYYWAGNKDLAQSYTIRAKEYCERINDQEGVAIYTQNLAHLNAG